MAKQSGLGDNFYYGGTDLSGDTNSLSKIGGGPAAIDVTAINKSGFERLGGLRTGDIEFVSYFNPTNAHPVLTALPRTDVDLMYCRGTTLGNAAAAMRAKQFDYDADRAANGAMTFKVSAQSNGFGIEWGKLLTAGLRTDTTATNGTGVDFSASTSLGFQAYLQVTAFSGTDVTIKLQDSANNSAFSDVTSGAFTAVTSGVQAQRI